MRKKKRGRKGEKKLRNDLTSEAKIAISGRLENLSRRRRCDGEL
jgi:hypothetical protein